MTRDELCFLTAVELRDLVAGGEVSAAEVTDAFRARIDEVNPALNAYVALVEEPAPAAPGPLHGVPVSVKDLIDTADLPTTYGCRVFADNRSGFDAVAVERLRGAGAVVLGKTNTSEFGLRPTTENSLFGPTSNPWNLERNSGGSSGGAASAAAAGISPLALGSDGGGSCRIPSSCCETVGLKPTRGRVPLAPAEYEAWAALVVTGPITRTVRDAALMLDVIAGPVLGEPYTVAPPETSFLEACERPPARLRIGYVAEFPDVEIDPEIVQAFESRLRVLESLGHDVFPLDPGLGGLKPAYMTVKQGNTAAMIRSLVPDESLSELESNTLAIARRGLEKTAADYCLAYDFLRMEGARILQAWRKIDVLATPTLTKLPLPHGLVPAMEDFDERWRFCFDWHSFTMVFNVTGQPAITVPAGRSRDDLPIGLQLVGGPAGDAQLLALAAAYEDARPWTGRRPAAAL